ncbi:hypothetical protein ACFXNW_15675 [Nocardia sp. NPDC059180]|uniref:hypothetical protein n=1 Tax=Nocardia sp. NPDC059180 TaxID=3346761 RepID=UPI0036912DA3
MSQQSRIDLAEMRAMVTSLERVIVDATRAVADLKAAIASAEAQSNGSVSSVHDQTSGLAVADIGAAAPVSAQCQAVARKPGPTPWSRRRPQTSAAYRPLPPDPQGASTPSASASASASASNEVASAAPPEVVEHPTVGTEQQQRDRMTLTMPDANITGARPESATRRHRPPTLPTTVAHTPRDDADPPATATATTRPHPSSAPAVLACPSRENALPTMLRPHTPTAAADMPHPQKSFRQPEAVVREPAVPHESAASREPATITHRPAAEPQLIATDNVLHRQHPAPPDSEAHSIAGQMAARHGLEIIGFDAAGIGPHIVQEIAAAVDDMLARYPLALQGIEITDPSGSVPARTVRIASPAIPPAAKIWMVLDGSALAMSAQQAGAASTRKWLRKRRNADRPVYSAVVREYGSALDAAGGFRARHQAQRLLIAESLRGSKDLAFSPLNPALALVDAFTAVALAGERAGTPAKELHDILVKIACPEPTDAAV